MPPAVERSYALVDVHDECQRFLQAVADFQKLHAATETCRPNDPPDPALVAAWGRIERSGIRLLLMIDAWGLGERDDAFQPSDDPVWDWIRRADSVDDEKDHTLGKHLAHLVLKCGPRSVDAVDVTCATEEVAILQWAAAMEAENLEIVGSRCARKDVERRTTHETGVGPKGMTWQAAKQSAERHCRSNPFPGVKALARLVRCSPSTMSKAIDRSRKLRALLAEHEVKRKRSSGASISDGITASAKQTREPDPSEAASLSTDELFHRLLDQCRTDSERSRLLQMSPAERRELVAIIENDPDNGQTATNRSRRPFANGRRAKTR